MPFRLRICRAVLLPALALLIVSCGEDAVPDSSSRSKTTTSLTSAAVLAPGPSGVGTRTLTFSDTSRSTPAHGSNPSQPSRRLVTQIWYPTTPNAGGTEDEQVNAPLVWSGPGVPLIMYSHGFMSSHTEGTYLADHLASYGYVVAAPDFPLSHIGTPGGATVADLPNQPGDVSFLIDTLLADGTFGPVIDRSRIGLTGLSLGGTTTLLIAFHPDLRDHRVRAAAAMAPGACFFAKPFYANAQLPLLLIDGDIDAITPYTENTLFAFGEVNPPKYLVTLIGGTHTGFSAAAGLFENQNNADDVGCGALGSSLTGGDLSLVDLLGGGAAGIIAGDCPLPCSGPKPFPYAMRPSRQHTLTVLSIFSFFEDALQGDASARAFLEHTLAAENADATTQFTR
jgi:predicted dienelactone hydrolase